jgi:hypothetical protein
VIRRAAGAARLGAALGLLLMVAGCAPRADVPEATSLPVASTAMDPRQAAAQPLVTRFPVRFTDVSAAAGLQWRFQNGATGRHLFIETTGGGVALFDADNDGWLDLFAVQGGPVPGAAGAARRFPRRSVLYHSNRDGTFTDVTVRAGLAAPCGYGQGVAAADYDNDGRTDLYVTAYGGNHLFHNDGGGTRGGPVHFTDVTRAAGVADRAAPMPWPLSAAWGDYDNDGRLDLFVCHYVRWSLRENRDCPQADGKLAYCRPQVYEGSHCRLYHNEGGGRFTDVTARSGVGRLTGKSMGAAWVDADEDGWPDLFVTNDTTPSFLLRNNRDGTFTDQGLLAGVAVGPSGEPLSGMGIGVADADGDGHADLAVVNFAGQPKTLYRGLGNGRFADLSYASNLAGSDLQFLGFGMEFLDYDLDGAPDLIYGNGHVLDNPEVLSNGATYAQSQQLFHNASDRARGGSVRFEEDRRSLGDLVHPRVTRGLAVGDVDNDGDPDVVLGAQNGPLQLFRNDGGDRSHWITFRLEGVRGNRDAIGARLSLRTLRLRQTGWVRGGSSYCSQSDRRVTFGLGSEREIRSLTVSWPGGSVQRFGRLPADRFYCLREGARPVPDPRQRAAQP